MQVLVSIAKDKHLPHSKHTKNYKHVVQGKHATHILCLYYIHRNVI